LISSISLTNFKNYSNARAEFLPKLNFIAGLNGSGKTNLLDAVHYICVTKSMHTSRDSYNVRFGEDFFRLDASLHHRDANHRIIAKVSPGKIKEFSIDGNILERLSDHVGFQPVIVLTPGDQVMIEGASAERRRFADFYLSQTDRHYLTSLMQYNKLLAQRNSLLKDKGPYADKVLLDTFIQRMTPLAEEIMKARAGFVADLNPFFMKFCALLSGNSDPVSLRYAPNLEKDLTSAANASLDSDVRLGRTTRGIHRDDLEFLLGGKLLRRYGSQGQRKTYLVSLHLALHDYLLHNGKEPPLFLLDDIFDKLDDQRILALLRLLGKEDFGQVFITDARHDRVVEICEQLDGHSRLFEVADGSIVGFTDHSNLKPKNEEE
jgi:DNA replication and repair protein RecF